MRFFLLLLTVFLFTVNGTAQDVDIELYKKRIERHLPKLIKHESLKNHFNFEENYLEVFEHPSDKRTGRPPEFRLYYTEIPLFLKIIYNASREEAIDFYQRKGTSAFPKSIAEKYDEFSLDRPTRFAGLRVAIDPGHFAGSEREAKQEAKFLKIKGEDIGQRKDLFFYEAQLTYATAEILREMLENELASVKLTRVQGESAVGKSFDKWYKEDFIRVRDEMCSEDELPESMCASLKADPGPKNAFFKLYKYLDFTGRADVINNYKADLTVVIHYNAKEDNPRDEKGYTTPTKENYAMAFIPGSFLQNELKKVDQRIDFLRLLLSDDMDRSEELASSYIQDHEETLEVPALPEDNSLRHIEYVNIYSGEEGVYHRNLYLTRAVKGAVVYGESLYQDNIDEIKKLTRSGLTYEQLLKNERLKEVAQSYFLAIENYLKYKEGDQKTNQ
ncbi:N-acetylmuramoyl-L-alanine amidase [Mangrovivirga sp. M17]|uniref:N-acetylmuramoyl-L-alanine amidase n=1 Tax=Mangrovivirga halotolerans TaxID=2993936 RepID=A0ABT3RP71_9BACT|nr:N-acetylmuramoyl-L-alanine amidase [Mangrovivirga halotolerans]MCX2743416.1 N-acetylmuramoyl-L-alanine amidase [Mangrovivirga halotolerans]